MQDLTLGRGREGPWETGGLTPGRGRRGHIRGRPATVSRGSRRARPGTRRGPGCPGRRACRSPGRAR
jgi:hypothetical protein